MHKLSKQHYYIVGLFVPSCALLAGGYLYDIITSETPCLLCNLQRVILGLIAITSLFSLRIPLDRVIKGLAIFGILVSLRHIYIVLFPLASTTCLPFAFVLQTPGTHFASTLLVWLSSIGRSCSEDVSIITYLLVPMLMTYYLYILLRFKEKAMLLQF